MSAILWRICEVGVQYKINMTEYERGGGYRTNKKCTGFWKVRNIRLRYKNSILAVRWLDWLDWIKLADDYEDPAGGHTGGGYQLEPAGRYHHHPPGWELRRAGPEELMQQLAQLSVAEPANRAPAAETDGFAGAEHKRGFTSFRYRPECKFFATIRTC